MNRLRRGDVIAVLAIVAALVLAIFAIAAGADAVALVLGIAISLAAAALIVVLWWVPSRRATRRAERSTHREIIEQGKRTRRAVHAAERRLYTQLEALSWLRDGLQLDSSLPPMRGAAGSPDMLLELVRVIDRSAPDVILELGSGVSTLVCAARCKASGRGRVVSLEHDETYAEATRAELRRLGLEDNATVLHQPLTDVSIGDGRWRWYSLDAALPEKIDLLFVDGPPGGVGHLARYPALPLLRERLTPGATVVVDDGDRPDEREMVERWQSEIEGIAVQYLPHAKGTWVLTMPHPAASDAG